MLQLPLELNKAPILTGKRDERISLSCSPEFKSLIDLIAKLQSTDISKLGQRYFMEGMSRDIGTMFMAEGHLESTLRDIIKKESG